MRYTDQEFDTLLIEALELTALQEWEAQLSNTKIEKQSTALQQRINYIIQSTEAKGINRQKPKSSHIRQRVASVIIALLLLSGITMLYPEARAFVVGLIRSWFEDHASYEVVDETIYVKPEDFSVLYLPDGFVLMNNSLVEGMRQSWYYEKANGEELSIRITTSNVKPHVDNENRRFYQKMTDNHTIDIYESTNVDFPHTVLIFLEEEKILITVNGTNLIDVLIDVALNIQVE